jgi:membrane-bound lytic murein transglycosylase B
VKLVAGVAAFVVLVGLGLLTVADDQASSVPAGQLAPMPARFRELYLAAAASCPGMPAELLMAVGEVESGHGADDGPSSAGAVGPMQFLPATFDHYAYPVPPGGAEPPTPWDAVDAVYAAARDLCANGARGGANLAGALYAYNHDTGYVARVLAVAAIYAGQDAVTATAAAVPTATVGSGGS